MKQIIAYIRPNKLPAVTLSLHQLPDLPGMSFVGVRGFSSDRLPKNGIPIVQDLIDYHPYVRIEIFCGDDQAYEIKRTIENAAHTGENGDGKIYISGVEETIHIQTHKHERSHEKCPQLELCRPIGAQTPVRAAARPPPEGPPSPA